MEKVDTLVVDKTGTLTEGRPTVTDVVPADGFEEAEILTLAAGVERASERWQLSSGSLGRAKTRSTRTGAVHQETSRHCRLGGKGQGLAVLHGRWIVAGTGAGAHSPKRPPIADRPPISNGA